LNVRFQVSTPTPFRLEIRGTGDPTAAWDIYRLTSLDRGVLANGTTGTMLTQQSYGIPILYSGLFLPGDVFTLNASSEFSLNGGGLSVHLTAVPEPTAAAFAGLLGFLLLARRLLA
jgi:hypothetical protein